jgi:hypothetical protein
MLPLSCSSLSTLAFTICFSTFLLLFVNWHSLVFCTAECEEAVGFSNGIFTAPTSFEILVFLYFGVFCLYWAWNLLSFFYTLRDALEMRAFYKDDLDISDVRNALTREKEAEE